MDKDNLIEFNSPPPAIKLNLNEEIGYQSSPGNNPFDTFTKFAEFQEVTQGNIDNIFDSIKDQQVEGRESLLLKERFDFGRDSLGTLQIDTSNTSYAADILTGPINPLDMGFLYSTASTLELPSFQISNRKLSTLSSGSSTSIMNPSLFNSASLNASEPSKIYSLGSASPMFLPNLSLSVTQGNLNYAFLKSDCDGLNSIENLKIGCGTSTKTKERLHSFPEASVKVVGQAVCDDEQRRTCSEDIGTCLEEQLNLQGSGETKDLSDSVFFEANYVASKIAGSSMLLDNSLGEDMLDNTMPPEFNDVEDSLCTSNKPSTGTIFKYIDKMLLPTQQEQIKLKLKTEDLNGNNKLAELPTETKKSTSKLQNANELLKNLSDVINSEHRDYKESNKLLDSLASILNSRNLTGDSLEDDSKSSLIEPKSQQNNSYEPLNLKIVIKDEQQALDLSVKPNNKCFSQSFSHSRLPPTKLFKSHTMFMGVISNTDKVKSESDPGRLSYKKPARASKNEVAKRGPLKAIIPVRNMSKCSSPLNQNVSNMRTPTKTDKEKLAFFNSKRTSTPIMESKLKPMAQSTPEEVHPNLKGNQTKDRSAQLNKVKLHTSSPSIRPNSFSNNSSRFSNSGRSGSIPNLVNRSMGTKIRGSLLPSPKNMQRRHSASELKAEKNSLKHWSTGGGDLKTATGDADKVKQGVLPVLSKKPGPINYNSLREKNGGAALPATKAAKMVGKPKKSSNKENRF